MRSCPDGDYKWIGHYKDHFSKFSIIWAQKRKCAYETINNMERFVFAFFGAPKIMQSDNGKEFNNQVHLAIFFKHTRQLCIFVYAVCSSVF